MSPATMSDQLITSLSESAKTLLIGPLIAGAITVLVEPIRRALRRNSLDFLQQKLKVLDESLRATSFNLSQERQDQLRDEVNLCVDQLLDLRAKKERRAGTRELREQHIMNWSALPWVPRLFTLPRPRTTRARWETVGCIIYAYAFLGFTYLLISTRLRELGRYAFVGLFCGLFILLIIGALIEWSIGLKKAAINLACRHDPSLEWSSTPRLKRFFSIPRPRSFKGFVLSSLWLGSSYLWIAMLLFLLYLFVTPFLPWPSLTLTDLNRLNSSHQDVYTPASFLMISLIRFMLQASFLFYLLSLLWSEMVRSARTKAALLGGKKKLHFFDAFVLPVPGSSYGWFMSLLFFLLVIISIRRIVGHLTAIVQRIEMLPGALYPIKGSQPFALTLVASSLASLVFLLITRNWLIKDAQRAISPSHEFT